MTRWGLMGALLVALFGGCSDRLATIQEQLAGTWVLESRQLPDGSTLQPPTISGALAWVPIDSRKAHVSLNVVQGKKEAADRRFNFAASLYEISTSAITQGRYVLVRQGYRTSAEAPFSIYNKGQKAKGKITVGTDQIEISHDNQKWVFQGNKMTASYDGAWIDTWKRVQ